MEFSEYFPIWDQLTPGQQEALSGSLVSRTVEGAGLLHITHENIAPDPISTSKIEEPAVRLKERYTINIAEWVIFAVTGERAAGFRALNSECVLSSGFGMVMFFSKGLAPFGKGWYIYISTVNRKRRFPRQ